MKAGNRYQIKTTAYFKYEFDKSYAFRNCISSFHQKHTIIGWKSAAVRAEAKPGLPLRKTKRTYGTRRKCTSFIKKS